MWNPQQVAGFEDHAGPCEVVKASLKTKHSSNHEEADTSIA